jgi:non-ribosomal peptide synthase protein (TIGR01720 family)
VSFNYLGQVDAVAGEGTPFTLASEGVGPLRGPSNRRPYLLEVDSVVRGGRLHVTWTYSTTVHFRETVQHLAEASLEALRRLIVQCKTPEVGGHTPSDFPLTRVNQGQLDKLSARFGKKNR